MSIEDRVRAATRARTDLVRDIRPLGLPDELPARGRRSRHARPARDPRRWLTWGAPIAAAALVTALALALVLLRQAPAPQPGPVAPTSASPGPSVIPRYYVALVNGSRGAGSNAVVGDDQTGRTVTVLNPAPGQSFDGVTGAADDRTFVVMNDTASTQVPQRNGSRPAPVAAWYLLRIAPGTAHPAQLTKLPIKPMAAHVSGLALSPDGRELAVMWQTAISTSAATHLAVYSMSSGAVLHAWTTQFDLNMSYGWSANAEALAWVDGDRSLDFRWIAPADYRWVGSPGPTVSDTIRTIDVTAPGGDLLADSRVVLQVPQIVTADKTGTRHSQPCANEVTAGDGTIVCGTISFASVSFEEACSTVPPLFVTYSGATGKQLKVLYQWHGQCLYASAYPLWTDSAGRHVIAFLLLSEKGIKTSKTDQIGLIADGKFTALSKLAVGEGADLDQGGLAF
jgi:hypothetical protein